MFKIVDSDERAQVYLYGRIGADFCGAGNSAKKFVEQLDELAPKPLDIHIDSGGGDVFEAFSICSAIQRYPGETTAYVDSMAASAASYITAVCDTVKMNDFAFIMIHNASSYAGGNAKYLRETADLLEKIDDTLVGIYAKRTNCSADDLREMMAAETWLTATEAKEHNFVQEIIETEERASACIDSASASGFKNIPDTVSVADELIDAVRERLEKTATSHPLNNLGEKVDEPVRQAEAEYLRLDGKLYRKESTNA